MARAVVLLSGGLDSATVLAYVKSLGLESVVLTVSYGQRHQVELEAARRVAKRFNVHDHRFAEVSLGIIGGSALTGDIDVPKDSLGEGIPVTYVPARNTIFLSLALGLAEVVLADSIWIGVNALDYSGYPDCRPEFIEAFTKLAQVATKTGVEGGHVRIEAPLINMSKTEIIKWGLELGVDFGETHSCYDPGLAGRACGHCDSCLLRARAFAELGMRDPVLGQ